MFELWQDQSSEDSVGRIATKVAAALSTSAPFCLWLEGSMGAGKTTTTREILYAIGLPTKVPVLSPTYTYMTEYQLADGRWFAHLDLYRMPDLSSIEEAGFDDRKNYAGVFVEWPPKAAEIHTDMLKPTHILKITPNDDGSERTYILCAAKG